MPTLSLATFVLWIAAILAEDTVVSPTPPNEIPAPLLESFISYSVEVAHFPGWIGTPSAPNVFTKNMLANIQNSQGSLPYIRIGGSSQDHTNYDASQTTAVVTNDASAPFQYTIGPAYLESYKTSGTKISQGLNFNSLLGDNAEATEKSLEAWAKAACGPLAPHLNVLELGNEPDSYIGAKAYAEKWKAATKYIIDVCPAFNNSGFMGPSTANPTSDFTLEVFQENLNSANEIKQISIHSYMSSKKDSATNTLQNTLMNHQKIDDLISTYLYQYNLYKKYAPDAPIIIGEGNSISMGGQQGLSNTFGAALWAFDYLLLAAGRGIRRVNFHQGVGVFYTAWKSSGDTSNPPITLPVYYGHLAAAAMIGSETGGRQILPLPRNSQYEAAYAAYVDGKLRRIAAVNLVQYNGTASKSTPEFTFKVGKDEEWTVMRLQGSGNANSEAIGTTMFNGVKCEYSAKTPGVCIQQPNTSTETIKAVSGSLTVKIPDSEAVVMYVHGDVS